MNTVKTLHIPTLADYKVVLFGPCTIGASVDAAYVESASMPEFNAWFNFAPILDVIHDIALYCGVSPIEEKAELYRDWRHTRMDEAEAAALDAKIDTIQSLWASYQGPIDEFLVFLASQGEVMTIIQYSGPVDPEKYAKYEPFFNEMAEAESWKSAKEARGAADLLDFEYHRDLIRKDHYRR